MCLKLIDMREIKSIILLNQILSCQKDLEIYLMKYFKYKKIQNLAL